MQLEADIVADDLFPAALLLPLPLLATDLFNEDAPHGLGGGREEMPPRIPMLHAVNIDQAQVRLVHQGRGLQRLGAALLGHVRTGQLPQLLVDQRQEFPRGARVPAADRGEIVILFLRVKRDHGRERAKLDMDAQLLVRLADRGCLKCIFKEDSTG